MVRLNLTDVWVSKASQMPKPQQRENPRKFVCFCSEDSHADCLGRTLREKQSAASEIACQGNVRHSILGHELEVNSRNDRHTSGALQLSARDTPNESMGAFLPEAT